MDEFNEMLISLAESRRKVAVSMLEANASNELPLTADEIARCEAELADCDAELAELRKD